MTTARYRLSSFEVTKISIKDQSFSEDDKAIWGVLTDPTFPDGTDVRDTSGDIAGPLRVLGFAKHAEPLVGPNGNVRNATQAEIDTYAAAELDDRNQQFVNRARDLLANDPTWRRLFTALLDEVREKPGGRPQKDLDEIRDDVLARMSKID